MRKRIDVPIPAANARRREGGDDAPPRAFSLIELVIVIAIVAVLAAIAIVRLSNASSTARTNAGDADRSVLQQAIDRYHAEHGEYPGELRIARQLTHFTDAAGITSTSRSARYCFGPYLLKVPPAPTGPNAGSAIIGGRSNTSAGWHYDEDTGTIRIWSPPPGHERDND